MCYITDILVNHELYIWSWPHNIINGAKKFLSPSAIIGQYITPMFVEIQVVIQHICQTYCITGHIKYSTQLCTVLYTVLLCYWLMYLVEYTFIIRVCSFLGVGTGTWTQAPHLEPFHQPYFCEGFFRDRVCWTICPGWLRTEILLISASWVARITGMSHWHLADCVPLKEVNCKTVCHVIPAVVLQSGVYHISLFLFYFW
jgi:hypothetical protein